MPGGYVQIGKVFIDLKTFTRMVKSIQAPALIIDQESKEPRGKSAPELMAASMQDAEGHAIPNSNHQVHQDQPEAVNDILLRFLKTKVCHVKV